MTPQLIDLALTCLGMEYVAGKQTIYTCHALRYAAFEEHYGRKPRNHEETCTPYGTLYSKVSELLDVYFDFSENRYGGGLPDWWSCDDQTEKTYKLRRENLLAFKQHLKGKA